MDYNMTRRKVALIRNRVFGSGKQWAAERLDTTFVEAMMMWYATRDDNKLDDSWLTGRNIKLDGSLDYFLTVPQEELEQIVVRFKVEREE